MLRGTSCSATLSRRHSQQAYPCLPLKCDWPQEGPHRLPMCATRSFRVGDRYNIAAYRRVRLIALIIHRQSIVGGNRSVISMTISQCAWHVKVRIPKHVHRFTCKDADRDSQLLPQTAKRHSVSLGTQDQHVEASTSNNTKRSPRNIRFEPQPLRLRLNLPPWLALNIRGLSHLRT